MSHALADDLLTMVRATSVSPSEEAAAGAFGDLLDRAGFTVTVDDWGNVLGTYVFGPGSVILHDAHLDTVEVPDPSLWQHDPSGELVDGVIYGRGVVDTKGSLVAALHAARDLIAGGWHSGTLVLTGSVGEELTEGPALQRILADVAPSAVVIGEPSQGRLMVGQRGRAEIVVEIVGEASHSAYPGVGVSAAEVMADCVVALRDVAPAVDPVLGPGLLTLTNLKSFPHPSQSMIPPRCMAVYDRRTVPGDSASEVVAEISEVVSAIARAAGATSEVRLAESDWQTWTGVDVRVPIWAEAWIEDRHSPVVARVVAGLEAAGVPPDLGHWPFCTNGSASAGRLGLPTIGFGPGDPARAHTVDEAITLADLQVGVQGYAAIFQALLEPPH